VTRPAVLVVGDVDANLLAFEAVLADLDCDVVRARSGNEALAFLLKRDFAAMLLDVQMPNMDGFEVARHARGNPKSAELPILFVTAMNRSEEGTLRGYGTGAVDFLFKPVNPTILRGKVRVFLDLWSGRARLKDLLRQVEESNVALKEAAAVTAKLANELAIKNAELESFSYSVSHDLRAPLRTVDGFSQMLEEALGPDLEGEAGEYLKRIRRASKRMGQLIEDLLALAKVGRQGMTVEQVDVTHVATSVVEALRLNEPDRQLEIVIAPGLAASADRRLVRIVFENLLGNAWKFTSKRTHGRVEVGRSLTDDGVAFYVRDNGAGFDPAYAERLFAAFQRLHKEAEFPGTGIGLATVQRVVHRHGGRIWAEASVDEGATFYFTLTAAPG
jgi:two-component system sensor histidine kinase/response regulator